MADQEASEYNIHENAISSLKGVVEQLEKSLAMALSASDELEGSTGSVGDAAVDRRSQLKQWIDSRTEEVARLENRLRSILARLDI